MVKRQVCLYIDTDLVDLAKSRNMNISEFVNDVLKTELDIPLELEKKDLNFENEIKKEIGIFSRSKQRIELLRNQRDKIEKLKQKERKDRESKIVYEVQT